MSKIDTLHPLIREKVRKGVNHVNTEILTGDVYMIVTQAKRDSAMQAELYAQGRTKPGKIVTNSAPDQSIHEYGLAFDFCLVKGKVTIWDTMADFDGDKHPDWMEVVQYFKSLG
jgi:peptidoglycan LD-endopeptidase CwlK